MMKHRKLRSLVSLSAILVSLLLAMIIGAHAQDGVSDPAIADDHAVDASASVQPGVQVGGESSLGSAVAEFWNKTLPFGYVIVAVFIIGVFLAMDEGRVTMLDRLRSRGVLGRDLRRLTESARSEILSQSKASRLVLLLRDLESLRRSGVSVNEIKREVDRRVDVLNSRFNGFLTRIDYLSESAGALGLLGTVWAIYQAFSQEAMASGDVDSLLRHTGLALTTTFLGLVASIVLNLLSTEVFNLHNSTMIQFTTKSEEYLESLGGADSPSPDPAGGVKRMTEKLLSSVSYGADGAEGGKK